MVKRMIHQVEAHSAKNHVLIRLSLENQYGTAAAPVGFGSPGYQNRKRGDDCRVSIADLSFIASSGYSARREDLLDEEPADIAPVVGG